MPTNMSSEKEKSNKAMNHDSTADSDIFNDEFRCERIKKAAMNRRKLSDDKIYPSESYISYCSLQSAKVSDRENNDERLLQAPSISVSLATRGSDAKQEREELGLLIQKLTADMGRVVEENKEMKKKLENLEQEKQENELLVSWLSAGHGRQSSLGRASVQDAIVYRDVPTTAPGQEGKGAQPLTTQKSRSFFGVKLTSNSAPRKEEKRPTRDKQRRKLASRDRARSPDDGLDTKSVDAIPTFKFGSTFERTLRKLQRKFSNMKAKFDNFRRLKPRLVELLKEKDKLEQENSSLIRQQIEISAQVTELRNARDELQFANEKLVEENKRLVCQFVSAPSSTEDGGSEKEFWPYGFEDFSPSTQSSDYNNSSRCEREGDENSDGDRTPTGRTAPPKFDLQHKQDEIDQVIKELDELLNDGDVTTV